MRVDDEVPEDLVTEELDTAFCFFKGEFIRELFFFMSFAGAAFKFESLGLFEDEVVPFCC